MKRLLVRILCLLFLLAFPLMAKLDTGMIMYMGDGIEPASSQAAEVDADTTVHMGDGIEPAPSQAAEVDTDTTVHTGGGIELELSQASVFVCETTYVTVTARYDETVVGDIEIKNDLGDPLAAIRNDGSGLGEVKIGLYEPSARAAYMVGVCGEVESEKAFYHVRPHVTKEAAATLDDIIMGMKNALAGIDDGKSQQAYDAVRTYLAKDERVENFGDNNGTILFQTTDGLMGFYGFHASDELVFGAADPVFTPITEAFRQYEEGVSVSDVVVASEIPLTNENVLFLSPQVTDSVIEWGRSAFDPRLRVLATEAGFEYQNVNGPAAVERICKGDFTDCGLLVFMAHGGQLLTRDGFMLTMKLGELTVDQRYMMADMTWAEKYTIGMTDDLKKTDDRTETAHIYYMNDQGAQVLYGLSQNEDGEYVYDCVITRSFLNHVLKEKKFDNTVAVFVVCYAKSDARLRELLFERGASAFVGTYDPLDAFIAFYTIEQIGDMTRKLADGTYTSLEDALAVVDQTPPDALIREYYDSLVNMGLNSSSLEELLTNTRENHAREQLENMMTPDFRTVESGGRVWKGSGAVHGCVADSSGNLVEGAKVRFYRWNNHHFQRETAADFTLTTDANGYYETKDLPLGQYMVQAEKDHMENEVYVEVKGKEVQAEKIVLSRQEIVVTTTVEEFENKNMTSLLMVPSVYLTNHPEAQDRINAQLTSICAQMESEQLQLRGAWAEDPEAKSSCDLIVRDIFSSGSLLFISFDEYRYTSGAARGYHIETSLAFDTKTGGQVELKSLITDDPEKRSALTTLLGAALEEKYAHDLFVSADDVADRIVGGQSGSWDLTATGLRATYPAGQITPQFVGTVQAEVPFNQLGGILPEAYLPSVAAGEGRVNVAFSQMEADYGTPGAAVLVADGSVQQVSVDLTRQGYSMMQVFYASGLTNQSAHLPEKGEYQYEITYYSGENEVKMDME